MNIKKEDLSYPIRFMLMLTIILAAGLTVVMLSFNRKKSRGINSKDIAIATAGLRTLMVYKMILEENPPSKIVVQIHGGRGIVVNSNMVQKGEIRVPTDTNIPVSLEIVTFQLQTEDLVSHYMYMDSFVYEANVYSGTNGYYAVYVKVFDNTLFGTAKSRWYDTDIDSMMSINRSNRRFTWTEIGYWYDGRHTSVTKHGKVIDMVELSPEEWNSVLSKCEENGR